MRVAIVGSRGSEVYDFTAYLPTDAMNAQTTEIVSGGARGIDRCAAAYAARKGWTLSEFKPDYRRYGRGAPLKRNEEIVAYADYVLIFWDGVSRGSRFVIEACERCGKPHRVIMMPQGG